MLGIVMHVDNHEFVFVLKELWPGPALAYVQVPGCWVFSSSLSVLQIKGHRCRGIRSVSVGNIVAICGKLAHDEGLSVEDHCCIFRSWTCFKFAQTISGHAEVGLVTQASNYTRANMPLPAGTFRACSTPVQPSIC